jgi:hypothetical protein
MAAVRLRPPPRPAARGARRLPRVDWTQRLRAGAGDRQVTSSLPARSTLLWRPVSGRRSRADCGRSSTLYRPSSARRGLCRRDREIARAASRAGLEPNARSPPPTILLADRRDRGGRGRGVEVPRCSPRTGRATEMGGLERLRQAALVPRRAEVEHVSQLRLRARLPHQLRATGTSASGKVAVERLQSRQTATRRPCPPSCSSRAVTCPFGPVAPHPSAASSIRLLGGVSASKLMPT